MNRHNVRKFLLNGPEVPGPLSASAAHYFPDIEFRPVRNREEFLEASHIVQQEYEAQGYVRPGSKSHRLNLYQVLPTTVTFAAVHKRDGILMTLTLIEDSPLGLPMDSLYHLELEELRHAGHRIFEVSAFASDKKKIEDCADLSLSGRTILVFHLIRAMFDHARMRGLDRLVECCHPKHDAFYASLEFQPFGGMRFHHNVQGSPAVARTLDLVEAERLGAEHTSGRLFMGPLPGASDAPQNVRFQESDLEEIFVQRSNVLASATIEKLKHIQRQYPNVDILRLAEKRHVFDYVLEALETRIATAG